MPQLQEIFAKEIDRPIEGVIKADDTTGLRTEVEEYVLTQEVAQRLSDFLDAYNNPTHVNGVWISGFFGSGKSHLLKMLSLLLENHEIDGTPMLELFLPKCDDDTFLRAEIEKAVRTPSKSILFNIDQKADITGKTETDALLAVFVKVFNDMCGYFGKQPYIAQFERDLDGRNLYEPFKAAYEQIAGQSWESGREVVLFEGDNIAQAYAQITDVSVESVQSVLDKYRDDYKLSIEEFAEQVYDYIEAQEPHFRLNFFVDEVGQYIADNVKLMTNLQTVAESLATKCHGRAWIIVTAQEDMTKVMGEMGGQQSNDFSKIQARFASRLKLTSTNVEEVIQKRLLYKNQRGIDLMSRVYEAQRNNFKTLFEFTDQSQSFGHFKTEEHFVHNYPFIPYQFTLFQAAIENLSVHNAFEGKHSSVGERSMLGVFQEVAKRLKEREIGKLATFDLMFEGIRASLKSQIQRAILNAERNLDNKFAVQVLKALFLVKYVKEFKASSNNVAILMYDSFDSDPLTLRKEVEESLSLLERETYIQRNGKLYEYLTDEEKDIEREIKSTDIENSQITKYLSRIVFDTILGSRKYRHPETKQDYTFAIKLDGQMQSQDRELTIHVVSPNYEHATSHEQLVRMSAFETTDLVVIMPSNVRLLNDAAMYLKTDKYIAQHGHSSAKETVRRIIEQKRLQNGERNNMVRTLVGESLSEATLLINGKEIEVNSAEPKTRILKGFEHLVTMTYPHLQMLHGHTYREEGIGKYFKVDETLFGSGDVAMLSEAETEMLGVIQTNNRTATLTTINTLVYQFERKPYGWYLAAIQCILAKLVGVGKVELRSDGNELMHEREILQAIRNTHGHNNVVVVPQIEFTRGQMQALKQFYRSFFTEMPQAAEAKQLGIETGAELRRYVGTLEDLQRQIAGYPFRDALREPLERVRQEMGKSYSYYLTELRRFEDDLLDLKEEVIDQIMRFVKGDMRQSYDEMRRFLERQQPNLSYVDDGRQAADLQAKLNSDQIYSGRALREAAALYEQQKPAIEARVAAEREASKAAVQGRWERLSGMAEFGELTAEQQDHLKRPFAEIEREIDRQQLIAVMKDTIRRFDNGRYQELLRQMASWAAPKPEPTDDADDDTADVEKQEWVRLQALSVPFNKAWLSSEEEIDAYLEMQRQKMIEALKDGKYIQI